MSPADRLAVMVRWIFGPTVPQVHEFHAGDVLIAEGETLRRPALLVIDGEVEECIGSYSQDGPGEHTVHVARTGDIADLEAVVAPFCEEPSHCSVHAMTSGTCYPLWRAQVVRRPELDAMLGLVYDAFLETIERHRAFAVECEDLAARVQELEGDDQRSRKMSASAVIGEWEDANVDQLRRKLDELQEEVDKAQLAAWEARERQGEAQRGLDLERRARAALEQRTVELMKQLAGQTEPEEAEGKFPNAIRILESAELEEMETQARRHRELAEDYVARARMLHRAFELLASDNPGIQIKPEVMQLIMGEEPSEPEPAEPSRPRRNTMPFESGSEPPPKAVAIPKSAAVPAIDESWASQEDLQDDDPPQHTPPSPGTKRSL
jgi:hypothetical protein